MGLLGLLVFGSVAVSLVRGVDGAKLRLHGRSDDRLYKLVRRMERRRYAPMPRS